MGIADFLGQLMRSVGNNMDNDPRDVLNTKQNFRNAGYLEDGQQELEAPFITRKMDDGIRAFQRDKNLKVDGIMKPGGETERGLFEFLTKQKADDVFGKPTNEGSYVGFGGNVSGTFAPVYQKEKQIPQGVLFSTVPWEKSDPSTMDTRGFLNSDDEKDEAFEDVETPQELPKDKANKNDALSKDEGDFSNNTVPPVPARKPEVVAPTAKGDALLDFIGKLESSGNYNVIVSGQERPLTKMTIKEVLQLQKDLDNKKQNTALGRYQIKNSTLKGVIARLGVNENEPFDEDMQDKMGRQLLQDRGFEDYKAGKISTKELIKFLAMEWAALPKDESNESYYKGIGNNKARTDFKTIKKVLENN